MYMHILKMHSLAKEARLSHNPLSIRVCVYVFVCALAREYTCSPASKCDWVR